jgi:hypothetical protein
LQDIDLIAGATEPDAPNIKRHAGYIKRSMFQGRWPLSKGRKGIAESSATASLYRKRIIFNG